MVSLTIAWFSTSICALR